MRSMDRFPRGTLPPSKFPKPARAPEAEIEKPAEAQPGRQPGLTEARSPNRACDLDTACPRCGTMMEPEHAHYRCRKCGYRDSCCF